MLLLHHRPITRDFNDKYNSIDLSKIGNISGSIQDLFSKDETLAKNMEKYIRILSTHALLNGVGGGQVEDVLSIRELSPLKDLRDGYYGYKLKTNEWLQHYTKIGIITPDENNPDRKGVPIYQTKKQPHDEGDKDYDEYNQKVILIYGLEFPHGVNNTNADELQFWIRGVRLINSIMLDKHYPDNQTTILFNSPILYELHEDMIVKYFYNSSFNNTWPDRVKLKGLVCTALGMENLG